MAEGYFPVLMRPLRYLRAKVRAWLDNTAQAKNLRAMQETAQSAKDIKDEFSGIRGILNQEISSLVQVRQEVSQEIDRLAQVRQQVRQEVYLLAKFSDQTRSDDPHDRRSAALEGADAGRLFALFSEAKRRIEHWEECEIIFSCPATDPGARSLFPEKTIVKVEQPRDIYQSLADKRFDTVGLLSPWLLPIFETYPEALLLLLRAYRDKVLYMDGYCNGVDNARFRKRLHRAGIYEIAAPSDSGGINFSTIGCMPDGCYSYRGSEPGLPSIPDDWRTHLASRLPLCGRTENLWRSATLNPLVSYGEAFGTERDGLALSITSANRGEVVPAHINVAGTIRWREGVPSRGHASLVACYAGPTDTHMYAGLMQVVEGSGPIVSIWMNNGQWRCLAHRQVPEGAVTTERSYSSLPLWLRVDSEEVSIGSGDICLITERNRELPRIPSAGIRVTENDISISNISVNFL